ncbi:MAG TPA: protein-disulfide reductase DsbD domain-containing protein, partial [Usitatibacter sp.]
MFALPPLLATVFAAVALLAPPVSRAAPLVRTEHVEADLVADQAGVQAGKPVLVGLRLRMAPQWHTYWRNPGDSGLPTKVQWILPEGWKAGELQWPFPQPLPVGPLMNYGYEDEVVLLAQLVPPASAPPGPAPIKVRAEWLVCKDICVPEKGEVDFSLPVVAVAAGPDRRFEGSIERALGMLPADPPGWKFEAALQGKSLIVRLTPPEGSSVPAKAMFFPERADLIEPAAPEKVTRDGRALRIEMKLADSPLTGLASLKGVAVSESGWSGSGGHKAINVAAMLGAPLAAAAGSTGPAGNGAVAGGMLAALALSFIGGMLLNLMPCVFPVLGIKVLGFVEHAHGNARAMRLQGVVFFAGVVASFLALAGIMLALRAGGMQLGW